LPLGSERRSPVRRICAWCGKDMGEKEPLEDQSATYGCCPECMAAVMGESLDEDRQGKEQHEVALSVV